MLSPIAVSSYKRGTRIVRFREDTLPISHGKRAAPFSNVRLNPTLPVRAVRTGAGVCVHVCAPYDELTCPSVTRSRARRRKLQKGLSRIRPHRSLLGYRAAYKRADAAPILRPHSRYRSAMSAQDDEKQMSKPCAHDMVIGNGFASRWLETC